MWHLLDFRGWTFILIVFFGGGGPGMKQGHWTFMRGGGVYGSWHHGHGNNPSRHSHTAGGEGEVISGVKEGRQARGGKGEGRESGVRSRRAGIGAVPLAESFCLHGSRGSKDEENADGNISLKDWASSGIERLI